MATVYVDSDSGPAARRVNKPGVAVKPALNDDGSAIFRAFDLYHDDGRGNGDYLGGLANVSLEDAIAVAGVLAERFYGR